MKLKLPLNKPHSAHLSLWSIKHLIHGLIIKMVVCRQKLIGQKLTELTRFLPRSVRYKYSCVRLYIETRLFTIILCMALEHT